MPFLEDIHTSSVSGDSADEKITSMARQLNEWAREISNEKTATVQKGEDGQVRIVQGIQNVDGTSLVGTVYYDNDNIDRILVGLHPVNGNPGIWISKEGESVIGLLTE